MTVASAPSQSIASAAAQLARDINAQLDQNTAAPAIVLSATYSGLAVVRSLGRQGVPVFVLDHRPWEVGMHSKYGRAIRMPAPPSEGETWAELLQHAGEQLHCRPILMATGDPHLQLLSEARAGLAPFYDFALPCSSTLDALLDKRKQYELLTRLGARLPVTIWPTSAEEAAEAADTIGYPCLAKPSSSAKWVAVSGAKLREIHRREEAAHTFEAMQAAGTGCVLQQNIPGGDDTLHGVLVCYSTEGQRLASIAKRKLRQFPEHYGNGSVQLSIDHPALEAEAATLFDALGYRGIGAIEYKRHPDDGQFYVMEINARVVSGLQLAIDAGCDLPWVSYCDLCGLDVAPPQPRAGVRFVNLSWEFQRAIATRSPLQFLGAAANAARARSFAALSASDPGPAVSLCRRIRGT